MDSYDKNRARFEREHGNLTNSNISSGNRKLCVQCGRRLLSANKDNLCPMCADQKLFADVRDYIRANDVKDYDVAEHFGIPLNKVKTWIKQGRIQYKDDPTIKNVIMGNYCQVCGTPTNFGNLCPRCLKEKKKSERKGVAINQPAAEGSHKMRFMEEDK